MLAGNISTSLSRLDIAFTYSLQTDEVIEALANRCSSSLTSLVIGGVTHNSGSVERATYSDCALMNIGRLTNLRKLHLFGVRCVTSQTLLSSIPILTDLRNLNLGCLHSIDDEVLTAIASSCTFLRKLRLERAPSILTLEGLIRSVSNLPHLSYLRLFGSEGFSPAQYRMDIHLPALSFSNMRVLDLYACSGLNDDGVEALLSRCPNLTTLIMTSIRNVTARAYHAIPKYCTKLEVLRMQYPESKRHFDFNYISLIARTYSETLEEWCLATSDACRDDFFLEFRKLNKLRRLEVDRTPSILTLRRVLSRFPALSLSLGDFPYSQSEGKAVEEEFPTAHISYYCR